LRAILTAFLIVDTFSLASMGDDGSGARSRTIKVPHLINTPCHQTGHALARTFPPLSSGATGHWPDARDDFD